VIDLRGTRIDVHARYWSTCAFNVETGIDLTGVVLHASVVDGDGTIFAALAVEILSPATAGVVRISAGSPFAFYGNTDAPADPINESLTMNWGLSKHVDAGGGEFYHEPLAYGKFALSGPLGLQLDVT
jgi:hypothetical protein